MTTNFLVLAVVVVAKVAGRLSPEDTGLVMVIELARLGQKIKSFLVFFSEGVVFFKPSSF